MPIFIPWDWTATRAEVGSGTYTHNILFTTQQCHQFCELNWRNIFFYLLGWTTVFATSDLSSTQLHLLGHLHNPFVWCNAKSFYCFLRLVFTVNAPEECSHMSSTVSALAIQTCVVSYWVLVYHVSPVSSRLQEQRCGVQTYVDVEVVWEWG